MKHYKKKFLSLATLSLILAISLIAFKNSNATDSSAGFRLDKVIEILFPILKKDEGLGTNIKKKDGVLYSCPYNCSAGSLTVGYGHVIETGDRWMLKCLSEAQSSTLLKRDIVEEYLMLEKTDSNYTLTMPVNVTAGMVRFQYNIGPFGLRKSQVHKLFKNVFFEHPEYLICDSVNELLLLTKQQYSEIKVQCSGKKEVSDSSLEICKQLKIVDYRNKLRFAFKSWNKITKNGKLEVLPALTQRRVSELEMIMPTCKSEISGLKF
jgi:GH24 family phage-related lysozyme (muramidase)